MSDNIPPLVPRIIEPTSIKAKSFDDQTIRHAAGSFVLDRLMSAFGVRALSDKEATLNKLKQSMTSFINAYSQESRFYIADQGDAGKMLIPNNPLFNASQLGANNEAFLTDRYPKTEIPWAKLENVIDPSKLKNLIAKYRNELLSDKPNEKGDIQRRVIKDLKAQNYSDDNR